MFTPVSVQTTRLNADGSPASGTITFTLNAEMLNGTVQVQPQPIAGVLNSEGKLTAQSGYALVLFANDDEATTPADPTAAYIVSEDIAGSSTVQYAVIIENAATIVDEHASATEGSPVVQLLDVLASSAMIGCVFSGVCAFDGDVTVIDYDPQANTLTVNADAVATVSGALTICHAVDLSTLAQYEPAPTVQTYIPFNLGQEVGQTPVWNGSAWVPGSAAGSESVVRSFAFAFDDAGLETGLELYVPTPGDILIDLWIEIESAWDGATPKGDAGDLASGSGWFSSIGFGALDMTVPDAPEFAPNLLSSPQVSSLYQAGIYSGPFRSLPAQFIEATPIKVVVSQDGTTSGGSPGSDRKSVV